jgi:hypothetical protein
LAVDEVGYHSRQLIGLISRPTIFDLNVTAFDETCFTQAQAECRHKIGPRLWCTSMEKTNHRHCRLLRPRYERPRRSRAAKQRDERASFHSITSSARSRIDGGSVMPINFAVFKFATS